MDGITETFSVNDFRELQRQLRKPVHIKKPRKYLRNHPKQASKKKKRVRLPSTSYLKKKADHFFSVFIIKRDKRCVLCGALDNLTNGHLIKRANMPTRYSELNCHCLCSKCNFKDWKMKNYHDVYVAWFIRKFGDKAYLKLIDLIRTEQWKRFNYQEIIDKYGR